LFVDDNSPGNTSGGDEDNRLLLSFGIDNGDVVTKTIGDERLALVFGKRTAPRAAAKENFRAGS
jgi:hypothetical protein